MHMRIEFIAPNCWEVFHRLHLFHSTHSIPLLRRARLPPPAPLPNDAEINIFWMNEKFQGPTWQCSQSGVKRNVRTEGKERRARMLMAKTACVSCGARSYLWLSGCEVPCNRLLKHLGKQTLPTPRHTPPFLCTFFQLLPCDFRKWLLFHSLNNLWIELK